MRSRDESIALRALTAAVESNNESLRTHGESLRLIIGRLDSIDAHISTLIDTVADHIANHGDTP